MKNKILALIALLAFSFTTFAQTNVEVILGENDKTKKEEKSKDSQQVTSIEKDDAVQESQVVTMAKSTGKKDWSDRSTAGKILIIAGCAVIVVLAILVPGGYNSRSGI